jgi:hypothetical protein
MSTAQVNILKVVYQKYREQNDVIESIRLTAQQFNKEPAWVAEQLGLLEYWKQYGETPQRRD